MSRSSLCIIYCCLAVATIAAEVPDRVEKPPAAPAWVDGYRIRWPLRFVGEPTNFTAQSIIACVPTDGWLKPDGSDIAVQGADGKIIPVHVLSHNPTGDTIIQFKRDGTNRWYWAYGVNTNAAPASGEAFPEGLTLEVRDWAGERLDSWAEAVDGLKKSDALIGNTLVPEIVQGCNPFRPSQSRKFAASYRGYLNITTNGTFRFLANADDAVFLFIDGFKVFERPGANLRLHGKLPVGTGGATIDLTNGVHTIEVHHIMGNNPQGGGSCVLTWVPPGQTNWVYVSRTNFVQAAYALTGEPQEVTGAQACSFNWGIEDPLLATGLNLFLVRFEAAGKIANTAGLVWDMGDGTTRTGRSFRHVYFAEGEYKVTLKSADGFPLSTQRVFVWPVYTGMDNPLALSRAVQSIREIDWKKHSPQNIFRIYQFLDACEQPDRWPLLEAVCQHLLAQPNQDPAARAGVYRSLLIAMAEQGHAKEALQTGAKALEELGKVGTFEVGLRLTMGDIQYRYLKDPDAATKEYRLIIEKFARLDAPEVRLAAVRLGDLAADLGDDGAAAEAYRLASQLGGRQFQSTDVTDTVKRGATLRIVEQRLRAGNITECRALLEKIELESPEQKLQGLYNYLRGEVDREGGRYEDAITSYERVLRQLQWAGIHDRATFGLADAYFRKGDLTKARDIVAKMKDVFPKFYEEKKLADYAKTIDDRLAFVAGQKVAAKSLEVAVGFEPGEPVEFGANSQGFPFVASQGMLGPHVMLVDNVPALRTDADWNIPVNNYNATGWYWVEAWYRDTLASARNFSNKNVVGYLYDLANRQVAGGAQGLISDPSYGQWRKIGMLLRPPAALTGRVVLWFRSATPHVTEIDSISVTPVSDRQYDAFRAYLSSREGQ